MFLSIHSVAAPWTIFCLESKLNVLPQFLSIKLTSACIRPFSNFYLFIITIKLGNAGVNMYEHFITIIAPNLSHIKGNFGMFWFHPLVLYVCLSVYLSIHMSVCLSMHALLSVFYVFDSFFIFTEWFETISLGR